MSSLVEIAKMGPKIVAAGAKELAELAGKTPNAEALAAKVAPAPVKSVRAARARAAEESGVTSGPGPAPVKRAVRTRKPAAPAPTTGPATPAPVSAGRVLSGPTTKEKQAAYWASRNRADLKARADADALREQARRARAGMSRNQAAADRRTEFDEGMKRAKVENETARRKKLQRTAAQAVGGTAAAAGGAVAARQAYRARKLRHLPAPGLNNSQKALVGVGAGATGGMLLAQRRRES